ncbi:MAG: DMT family transporter [Calditrichaeota bacterium]|nr:MAG: DMT family transporter [Calditrichota bacterium]
MNLLVFSLLCFIWGTTWIAIKISLVGTPPFLGAALRFGTAVICLQLYAGLRRTSLKLTRQDLGTLYLSGILLYAVDYGLIYWGEQYLNAGVTAVFFATFPLFTGIFSHTLFRSEPFTPLRLAGLVLAFLGMVVVFYDQLLATRFDWRVALAVGAVVLSAASAAIALLLVKKYLMHLDSLKISLHQMYVGVPVLIGVALLRGEFSRLQLSGQVIAAVLYLGVVGSALAFLMYYWLLRRMSAITLSTTIYITPVIALLGGWLLLDEYLGLKTVLGILLIFAGIALSQWHAYRNFWASRRGRPRVPAR